MKKILNMSILKGTKSIITQIHVHILLYAFYFFIIIKENIFYQFNIDKTKHSRQ